MGRCARIKQNTQESTRKGPGRCVRQDSIVSYSRQEGMSTVTDSKSFCRPFAISKDAKVPSTFHVAKHELKQNAQGVF